jgi:hypothetical protein
LDDFYIVENQSRARSGDGGGVQSPKKFNSGGQSSDRQNRLTVETDSPNIGRERGSLGSPGVNYRETLVKLTKSYENLAELKESNLDLRAKNYAAQAVNLKLAKDLTDAKRERDDALNNTRFMEDKNVSKNDYIGRLEANLKTVRSDFEISAKNYQNLYVWVQQQNQGMSQSLYLAQQGGQLLDPGMTTYVNQIIGLMNFNPFTNKYMTTDDGSPLLANGIPTAENVRKSSFSLNVLPVIEEQMNEVAAELEESRPESQIDAGENGSGKMPDVGVTVERKKLAKTLDKNILFKKNEKKSEVLIFGQTKEGQAGYRDNYPDEFRKKTKKESDLLSRSKEDLGKLDTKDQTADVDSKSATSKNRYTKGVLKNAPVSNGIKTKKVVGNGPVVPEIQCDVAAEKILQEKAVSARSGKPPKKDNIKDFGYGSRHSLKDKKPVKKIADDSKSVKSFKSRKSVKSSKSVKSEKSPMKNSQVSAKKIVGGSPNQSPIRGPGVPPIDLEKYLFGKKVDTSQKLLPRTPRADTDRSSREPYSQARAYASPNRATDKGTKPPLSSRTTKKSDEQRTPGPNLKILCTENEAKFGLTSEKRLTQQGAVMNVQDYNQKYDEKYNKFHKSIKAEQVKPMVHKAKSQSAAKLKWGSINEKPIIVGKKNSSFNDENIQIISEPKFEIPANGNIGPHKSREGHEEPRKDIDTSARRLEESCNSPIWTALQKVAVEVGRKKSSFVINAIRNLNTSDDPNVSENTDGLLYSNLPGKKVITDSKEMLSENFEIIEQGPPQGAPKNLPSNSKKIHNKNMDENRRLSGAKYLPTSIILHGYDNVTGTETFPNGPRAKSPMEGLSSRVGKAGSGHKLGTGKITALMNEKRMKSESKVGD